MKHFRKDSQSKRENLVSYAHHISESDISSIHRLISDSLDLVNRPGEASAHFLDGLRGLVQAEAPATILYTGQMVPVAGLPFDYRGRQHIGELPQQWIDKFDWRLARGFSPVLDGMRQNVLTASVVGSLHVKTRQSLVPDTIWKRSPIYEGDILPLKISDQLFAWYQTDNFAVNFIIRGTERRHFTERDAALIETALKMLDHEKTLKFQIRPESTQPLLSPRQIQVRNLLICGLNNEEIRVRLSTVKQPITNDTVARHIKFVLQKYKISGRRSKLTNEYFIRGGDANDVLRQHALENADSMPFKAVDS